MNSSLQMNSNVSTKLEVIQRFTKVIQTQSDKMWSNVQNELVTVCSLQDFTEPNQCIIS